MRGGTNSVRRMVKSWRLVDSNQWSSGMLKSILEWSSSHPIPQWLLVPALNVVTLWILLATGVEHMCGIYRSLCQRLGGFAAPSDAKFVDGPEVVPSRK